MTARDHSSQPSNDITLGQRIREARERRGLSLRQFAAQIGRDSGYVSRLEGDFYEHPGLSILHRIAETLGVDYVELVTLTGQTVPVKLPELADYLAAKYDLADDTAGKLAEQFNNILDEHNAGERPERPEGKH